MDARSPEKPRKSFARAVQWRTVRAFALSFLGFLALLALFVVGLVTLQPFGRRGWTFTWLALILVGLCWPRRYRPEFRGGVRFVGRILGPIRRPLVVLLAFWMGLIAWSFACPGGAEPVPKEDPESIRVISWNILLGQDTGLPWSRHDWPTRKPALRAALRQANPDVLCVQEALPGQVAFLQEALPTHRRVGVGRDDGRASGEHCAIYFDAARFRELGNGTFWLEPPEDKPPDRTTLFPKRICTWVRLRDRRTGRDFRVYNAHLYLTEPARQRAVSVILTRIATGDPADAVLVAGDFNATPEAGCRKLFAEAGLISCAQIAGERASTPTYHFYGVRLRSFDAILADRSWRVCGYRALDVKPGNTFPSDHFGVWADLRLGGGSDVRQRLQEDAAEVEEEGEEEAEPGREAGPSLVGPAC